MLAFATRRHLKRSESTRRLRGGKYTGKGTYGCGFAPALRCEGETVRKFGLFTKLMMKDEAEKEEAKVAIIQPVDPAMKYILYPVKICKVNKSVLGANNPENDVQSCPLGRFPRDLDQARAVQYIDGGIDFEKFQVEAYKVLPVFESLPNLFLGLYKIHKAGVSHNDIKPSNMVVKENEDGTFTSRYIDIGFVHTMKDGVKHGEDLPFNADYYPWPYEMRFSIRPLQHPSEKTIRDWYTVYRHQMFKYLPHEHLYNSDGSKKYTIRLASAIFQAIALKATRAIPSLSKENATNTEKIKERSELVHKKMSELILQKVDTYSLGNVLLYVYDRMIHHRLNNGVVEFEIARTRAYHDVDTLEAQGIPEATRKWHQDVAKEITKPYVELCLQMMSLDPKDRRALPISLVIYRQLLKKMKTWFTKEQIETHIMQWK